MALDHHKPFTRSADGPTVISLGGLVVGVQKLVEGQRILDFTSEFTPSERARMLLASMGEAGMIQKGVYYKTGDTNNVPVIVGTPDSGHEQSCDAQTMDIIKIGYDDAQHRAVSSSFAKFHDTTAAIVKTWNEQMSDGRGFVAFLFGRGVPEKDLVSNVSVMSCHPCDALIFLQENFYPYALAGGKNESPSDSH